MQTIIVSIIVSFGTAYFTAKIICKSLLRKLDEIEMKHRERLLSVAEDFINQFSQR